MKKRRELLLLQQTFKAIHFANWSQYLSLEQSVDDRNLRSQRNNRLNVPLENRTFQDNASKLFNFFCKDFKTFGKLAKEFLIERM